MEVLCCCRCCCFRSVFVSGCFCFFFLSSCIGISHNTFSSVCVRVCWVRLSIHGSYRVLVCVNDYGKLPVFVRMSVCSLCICLELESNVSEQSVNKPADQSAVACTYRLHSIAFALDTHFARYRFVYFCVFNYYYLHALFEQAWEKITIIAAIFPYDSVRSVLIRHSVSKVFQREKRAKSSIYANGHLQINQMW